MEEEEEEEEEEEQVGEEKNRRRKNKKKNELEEKTNYRNRVRFACAISKRKQQSHAAFYGSPSTNRI